MEHTTQVALIQRVLDQLEQRASNMVDQVSTVPVEHYTSKERLELELEVLFRASPRIVAHGSQLPHPGDFLTQDHCEVPVLLVRDDTGRVNAFLNVCRHRGTRLVMAAAGNTRRSFVCPYHAWTYGHDGALLGMTDDYGFPGIDPCAYGLARLPVVERDGFVWLAPSPAATIDLDASLGPLAADFRAFDLSSHVAYKPMQFRKALNWKMSIEVFLEAYHVKYVHAKSIYPIFFNNIGVFERFGAHQRNVFPKRTLETLRAQDRQAWRMRPHLNLLYVLFPNTLMLVQPDHMSMFHVYPLGADATNIVTYTLIPQPPESAKAERHWDRNNEILHAAVMEDLTIGESIQQGIRSGANAQFTLGRFEQSLMWFHASVEAALGL